MRPRTVLPTVAAVLALVFASVSGAAAGLTAPAAGPGPGHFTSDNVEWVTVKPEHTGSSGGRLLDGYFYVTDPRGVYIYDVSSPASPVLKGSVRIVQSGLGLVLGQEDPDTNGKILLVDAVDPNAPAASNKLLVVDVSNKTSPKVVGSVATTDHTWTCVLDCTYAYGRTGDIIDLTNPADPKKAANWKTTAKPTPGYTHDFTEVAPGFLMSSGQPSLYIDARDPVKPRTLTQIKTTFSSLGYHGAQWPQGAKDDFLLMGTELAPLPAASDCQGDGILATYDATEVRAADEFAAQNPDEPRPNAEFKKVDEWRLPGRGAWADGKAPGNTLLYCTHWFDAHPDFNGGGLVAMGAYDWGTRFLNISDQGKISEVGWFQPVGGLTAAAYWISKDVVYTLDYRRGLDVLRFKPTTE